VGKRRRAEAINEGESSMNKLLVFSVVGVVCSTAALAQVTGDTCVKLAETVAAGYSTSFSDRSFEAARYYANCETSQSSGSGGLNLAYAAFSLGVKFDDAQRRAYCSKSFEQYNIKATEYNSVKIVFNQALATIDKCLDVAGKGWTIRYEQIATNIVSLNISNGGGTGGRLLGVDIVPQGALTCTPAPPTEPVVVTTTNPISTTCSRTPTTQVVDGISVTSAPEAVLNLRLSDGLFPIKMPAYSTSIIDGINRKIDALRADLATQITAQVQQLRDSLKQTAPGDIHTIDSRDATCGPGEYLVGFLIRDQPGLGHGALWGPIARCKKLNLGSDAR
jgi:hypothetical protein